MKKEKIDGTLKNNLRSVTPKIERLTAYKK